MIDQPVALITGASGDLGRSVVTQQSVWSEFVTLFPATVELSVSAMLFAIIIGVPVGTQVPATGGSASKTGMPPTRTLVLPDGMMPLTQGPFAAGGGGKAHPATTYDAGMVTTG